MSKSETVTIHNGDIVLAVLRAIAKPDGVSDLGTIRAMAQSAIDFATNDEEALAEGRALQPPESPDAD